MSDAFAVSFVTTEKFDQLEQQQAHAKKVVAKIAKMKVDLMLLTCVLRSIAAGKSCPTVGPLWEIAAPQMIFPIPANFVANPRAPLTTSHIPAHIMIHPP